MTEECFSEVKGEFQDRKSNWVISTVDGCGSTQIRMSPNNGDKKERRTCRMQRARIGMISNFSTAIMDAGRPWRSAFEFEENYSHIEFYTQANYQSSICFWVSSV